MNRTRTPAGFHDAVAWLQVRPNIRPSSTWDRNQGAGDFVVEGIKVEAVTQGRPDPPRKGCIAMEVTIRVADAALLPLQPKVVVTVPADRTIAGEPIEVTVGEIDDEDSEPGALP